MADKRKQLITNVAIGYVLVSVVLFAIFIFTYRMYWFRIHRQFIEFRAKQSEQVKLLEVRRPFLLENERRKAEANSHTKLLSELGEAMLDEMQARLEAISQKDVIEDFEAPDEKPAFIETPLETDGEKGLEELLKPVLPKLAGGPFEKIISSVAERTRGLIEFRVFDSDIEQMVPLNWTSIGSRKMELISEKGEVMNWDLRAYVVPKRISKVALSDVEKDMDELEPMLRRRLGVYAFGELSPIYRGADYEFEPSDLEHYEAKAEDHGKLRYESPEPLSLRGTYLGEEMDKLRMRSFLSDPELGLTFVLENDLYEHEWRNNRFFTRNRVPIMTYAIMAWLVCPLVFWFAVRQTNRFQFQFTADLEADEDVFPPKMAIPHQPVLSEDESPEPERATDEDSPSPAGVEHSEGEATSDVAEESSPTYVDEKETEEAQNEVQEATSRESEVPKTKTVLGESERVAEGPLTRRLRDPAEMSQPLDRGDIDEIRQNNIRKSSGSFNRNRESEEDVDYLAGVESDVLKSLIKKLREQ